MAGAFYQRRLYLQDALLRCRSEFMTCATAEIVDNEAVLLLAGQLFDLETRLAMLRRQMSGEESGIEARCTAETELCIGM